MTILGYADNIGQEQTLQCSENSVWLDIVFQASSYLQVI
jgi:hypothetical protein